MHGFVVSFCLSETSCPQEDNYPNSLCIKVNGKLFPLPVSSYMLAIFNKLLECRAFLLSKWRMVLSITCKSILYDAYFCTRAMRHHLRTVSSRRDQADL